MERSLLITIVETTLTRVMAGDRSLIKVIESNAEPNAPMQTAMSNAILLQGMGQRMICWIR